MRLSAESANVEFDTGPIEIPISSTYPLFLTQQINMRTVLGDMLDKYNKFMMVFNGIASTSSAAMTYSAGTVTTINNTAAWTCGMSGDLQFVGNTVNGQLSNIAYFPTRFTLAANGSNITNASCINGVVFLKPSNSIVTINVAPYLIRGGGAGSVVTSGANSVTYDVNFSFTIFGLSE
jgi:hypothetical protein